MSTTPATPTTTDLLSEIDIAFEAPVLPDDPFPERVTSRNGEMVERLTAWADEARDAATSLADRLREQPEDADVSARASARLRRLAREWRVFETFRRLHEGARCPGALFRLHTKSEFLTLCAADADSSPAGYGERQRHALAKRGISHRLLWAEARGLVARIGLLDDVVNSGAALPASGDGLATADGTPKWSVASAPPTDMPEGVPEAALVNAETPDLAEAADCDLPDVRLAAVWILLPGLTKAKLAAVIERFGTGLWAQFGDRFYASMRKAEMLDHARRVVRHHAGLDAAQQLPERGVEDLYDWMRGALGGSSSRGHRDPDLRIAARLFADLQAGAALSAAGDGLSPDAWNRYRDAELRRIAAFCYHRFYEDRCAHPVSTRKPGV